MAVLFIHHWLDCLSEPWDIDLREQEECSVVLMKIMNVEMLLMVPEDEDE